METQSLAKWLILTGVLLAVTGFVLYLSPKIPWLGRLPGDIYIKKEGVSFYIPLASCLILSAVVSWVFYLFKK